MKRATIAILLLAASPAVAQETVDPCPSCTPDTDPYSGVPPVYEPPPSPWTVIMTPRGTTTCTVLSGGTVICN